ncbi:MAG: hypothetical protein KAR57_00455 [Bacteroidales bacterium]|nr:hypothetical protein [Bacteroidales bacterium]
MKAKPHYIFVLFLLFFAGIQSQAQEKILAGEKWQQLTEKEFLVDFFKDFFINLGVEVQETGERITVMHQGDHFKIVEGIDENIVDYILPIRTQNIVNLINHAEDGKIDEMETYKIVALLFTPMTAMTLQNPLMTENLPRFFNKIENNIHVTLTSPDKSESVSHTLIYINKEWIVISGLHGTPKRIFNLNIEQGVDYQKHVFEAINTNTKKNWKTFKKWYLGWRKEVSVAG